MRSRQLPLSATAVPTIERYSNLPVLMPAIPSRSTGFVEEPNGTGEDDFESGHESAGTPNWKLPAFEPDWDGKSSINE